MKGYSNLDYAASDIEFGMDDFAMLDSRSLLQLLGGVELSSRDEDAIYSTITESPTGRCAQNMI